MNKSLDYLEVPLSLKPTFGRKISQDDASNMTKPSQGVNLNRRLTFSSSLSGSVTSLNSSSSRSRGSSAQDEQLSTSSSSASIASTSLTQPQASALNSDSNPNTVPFVDRRKAVGGKIRPFVPDYNDENDRKLTKTANGKSTTIIRRATTQNTAAHKRKSLQLTLISPSQIRQTAKLGKKKILYH